MIAIKHSISINNVNLFKLSESDRFQFNPIECLSETNTDHVHHLDCWDLEFKIPDLINSFAKDDQSQRFQSVDITNSDKNPNILSDSEVTKSAYCLPSKNECGVDTDHCISKANAFTNEEAKEEKETYSRYSKRSQTIDSCFKIPRDCSRKQKNVETSRQNQRWSKQQDVVLFKVLNEFSNKFNFDVTKIEFDKGKVNKLHRNFLNTVKQKVGWKGTLVELKDRIIKVRSSNKFTARESKVLKDYLKEFDNKTISMEQILENFPGKTVEQILDFEENS